MATVTNHNFGHMSEMAVDPVLNIQYHEDVAIQPANTHPVYKIGYYLDGTVERYVVGTKSYHLRPGDVLIIPPETVHYPVFAVAGEKTFRCFELILSPEQLAGVDTFNAEVMSILNVCQKNRLYRIRSSVSLGNYRLEDYMDAMWRETNGSILCKPEYLQSLCMHFMIQLNRIVAYEHMSAFSRSSSDCLLDMVIGHIQKNFHQPLSLKTVADRYFTSPSNVELLFRSRLGCPFYRYVTECRIIHAQKLIGAGIPMKEVCTACGYNDYSNFYRAFTKVTGITPTKYRQRFSLELLPRKVN